MNMSDLNRISSTRLGIDAYVKATGRRQPPAAMPKIRPSAPKKPRSPQVDEGASRTLKASVLSSLHQQSNAGMVSIKDVATALDHLLKKS